MVATSIAIVLANAKPPGGVVNGSALHAHAATAEHMQCCVPPSSVRMHDISRVDL